MRLSALARAAEGTVYGEDCLITGISCNSKSLSPGDLFFALSGKECDGREYIAEAIQRGASAIVCEAPFDCSLPYVVVKNGRCALAKASAAFYGNPERELSIVTVTGTNGKTSSCHLLAGILKNVGVPCGTVGTLGAFAEDLCLPTSLTTPDPPELFSLLKRMKDTGVKAVVMEASAHAIYWQKLCGICAEVGIFTNITQDHLDFFGDIKEYAGVKQEYFRSENCRCAVINSDDCYGKEILAKADCNKLSYSRKEEADIMAYRECQNANGVSFLLKIKGREYAVESPLFGGFNVYNLLAAIGAATALGVSEQEIVSAIPTLQAPEGRFQVIPDASGAKIVIDFAHTPDGMRSILTALRPITKGRLIAVFGCGGNRDKTKRAIMGEIAAEYADFCVITSDNPRFERPADIINEIEQGVKAVSANYIAIENRREAIRYALSLAGDGDTVAVLGKGAEAYQEIGGIRFTYKDEDVIRCLLRKR